MFKKLISFLILPTLALCAILPNILDNDDSLQGTVISPTLSYAENSSTIYGNRSVGNNLMLKCDKIPYGRDLKVESCRKVFNYLKADDTEVGFADRSSAQPHDVSLPLRTTSSKCPHRNTLSLIQVTFKKRKSVAILVVC